MSTSNFGFPNSPRQGQGQASAGNEGPAPAGSPGQKPAWREPTVSYENSPARNRLIAAQDEARARYHAASGETSATTRPTARRGPWAGR